MKTRLIALAAGLLAVGAALAAYHFHHHPKESSPTAMREGHWPRPMPAVALSYPPRGDPVLVGAGDIANCKILAGAEATARLVEKIPGEVFTAGDDAMPAGAAEEFRDCYGPTWGRFKDRTRPATGNHEFHSGGAAPYFDYFGAAAGDPLSGYYSYDLGTWHVIALNSECDQIGGCEQGSTQERWLRKDLQTHRGVCTVAYWHKPLFSSGAAHGNDLEVKPFWEDLYAAHATIAINGHDHDYERFAPQDPDGKADPTHGIREFVVGTGGNHERTFLASPLPNSQVRMTGTFGVLKLTLHPRGYDWQFIPQEGRTFVDSGSGLCQ